jgi:hypothetical protein
MIDNKDVDSTIAEGDQPEQDSQDQLSLHLPEGDQPEQDSQDQLSLHLPEADQA